MGQRLFLLPKRLRINLCKNMLERIVHVLTVHDPFPHSGEVSMRKSFNYKVAMNSAKKIVLLNNRQKYDSVQL